MDKNASFGQRRSQFSSGKGKERAREAADADVRRTADGGVEMTFIPRTTASGEDYDDDEKPQKPGKGKGKEKERENESDSFSRSRHGYQEDVLVDDVGGDGCACIFVKEDLEILRGSAPGKGNLKLALGEDRVSEVSANVLD